MTDRFVPLVICCAVVLASALGMVLARRLVRCAALLLVHSLAIAATYFTMSAEFLAMGQVVVYTGAIVVLFLFVVLLLPEGGKESMPNGARLAVAFTAGAAMFGALLVATWAVIDAGAPPDPAAVPDLSTPAVARVLFGPHLVPFELTALLLLIAILGAVTLWHRQQGEARR